MKKIITCLLLSLGFFCFNYGSAYVDCGYKQQQCNDWYTIYQNNSYYYNEALSACSAFDNCETIRKQQLQEMMDSNQAGLDYLNGGNYEEAISNFQKALKIIGDVNDSNYAIVQGNLMLSYQGMGDLYFAKDNLDKSLEYYNKALKIDKKNFDSLFAIGFIYFKKESYQNALNYLKKAYSVATTQEDIDSAQGYEVITDMIIKDIKEQKNRVTDDPFSYRLPHVKLHNIYKAWKKVYTGSMVDKSNTVTVAIIDDGTNLNHPDLSDNLWTNENEKLGDGIDNDRNGYKDDFNGWNFVYNNNNIIPLGNHGTMVAGIIGAVRNNKEGIAGVVRDIRIMTIGVLDENGETPTNKVVQGINYAIDNGADIINLSLGGHQFKYEKGYDAAIQRAYRKGIIVVIAAGNGDVLSNGTRGTNTTINKISPLCNHGDNLKSIIGVASLDAAGNLSSRSNYGKCAQFYGLGELLYSTVVKAYSENELEYGYGDGTSFSTPVVAGIVGLGYNKYGKVRPDFVWDALKESMGTGIIIDADKYLDILGKKISDSPFSYKEMPLTGFEKFRYRIIDFIHYLAKEIKVDIGLFYKSKAIDETFQTTNF